MCKGPEAEAGLDILEAMQEVQLGWSKDAREKTEPDELLLKAVNEPLAIAHVACHAVITWLSCTTHLADHAMIM